MSSPNFNQFQNAYWPRHSTETCLLGTLDDIFSSSNSGNSTLLVSLDFSAAFDSIDHAILLSRLKSSFGFAGMVHNWIESYFTGRSQSVVIGNNSSAPTLLASGVPQGSVLGPLFSVSTPHLLLILPLLSLSIRSNTLMTRNSTLLFRHPASPLKLTVLKTVSLLCMPGVAKTLYT